MTKVIFSALKFNILRLCFTVSFLSKGYSFTFAKSFSFLVSTPKTLQNNNHFQKKMSMTTNSVSDADVEKSWTVYRLTDNEAIENDWVKNLELDSAKACISHTGFLPHGDDGHPPRILLLYGSLRTRSFSKFLCYEFARILELLGAECRVFDPRGLPQHDTENYSNHPKVLELRTLNQWSEGQVWYDSIL